MKACPERTELKNSSVFKAAKKFCVGPNSQIFLYVWKNVNTIKFFPKLQPSLVDQTVMETQIAMLSQLFKPEPEAQLHLVQL